MYLDEFDLREMKLQLGAVGFGRFCNQNKIVTNVAGIKYLESLGIA